MCLLLKLVRFLWFLDLKKRFIYFLLPISELQAYFISLVSILHLSFFFYQGYIISFLDTLMLHDTTVIFWSEFKNLNIFSFDSFNFYVLKSFILKNSIIIDNWIFDHDSFFNHYLRFKKFYV